MAPETDRTFRQNKISGIERSFKFKFRALIH